MFVFFLILGIAGMVILGWALVSGKLDPDDIGHCLMWAVGLIMSSAMVTLGVLGLVWGVQ